MHSHPGDRAVLTKLNLYPAVCSQPYMRGNFTFPTEFQKTKASKDGEQSQKRVSHGGLLHLSAHTKTSLKTSSWDMNSLDLSVYSQLPFYLVPAALSSPRFPDPPSD